MRSIEVANAWARLGRDDRRMATVYFQIVNNSAEADTLVGVSVPIADKTLLSQPHWRGMKMTMRQIEEIDVPATTTVILRPGAAQVDVIQLSHDFRPNQTIPLELKFRRAGRVEVIATISNKLLPDQLRTVKQPRPRPEIPPRAE